MKSRTPSFILVALLGWAHVAAAQSVAAGGSLTVLSRPSGASFRITGEQVVVGRTPMTFARGLTGRYEVRSLEPGYATWRREVHLDGVSADTLWMTLQRKGAAGAGLRSLIVPGWGQFYSGRPGMGATFLAAGLVTGAAFGLTSWRYHDRVTDYDAANDRYQAATTQSAIDAAFAARQSASNRAEDAYKQRQIAMGVAGGVWGLAVLDALLHFPKVSEGGVSLELAPPQPGAGVMPLAALTVRF
jgi:hypothetical protein